MIAIGQGWTANSGRAFGGEVRGRETPSRPGSNESGAATSRHRNNRPAHETSVVRLAQNVSVAGPGFHCRGT